MAYGFELKTHPYCDSCSEFDVYVEEMDYGTFFGKDAYSRTITCRHYQRCEAIEKHLRKEISKNEDSTSIVRDTD